MNAHRNFCANISLKLNMQVESDSGSESSESSGEFLVSRGAGRNPDLCRICSKPAAKYKCPKCGVRTCSTFCCTQHKKQFSCSGVRTNTEYIPRSEYQEPQSRDDYKFLLRMMDGVDKVKKTLTGISSPPEQMRFKLLKRHAKLHYDCDVKIAPNVIERHRENISFYFVQTKEIFWMFELQYYVHGGQSVRFLTDPVCDKLTLDKVLSQQFFSPEMLAKQQINTTFSSEFRVLIKNDYNHRAVDTEIDHIAKGKSRHQYIEVTLNTLICDLLRHLSVTEFPTLLMLHEKYIVPFCSKNWVAFLHPSEPAA